MRSRHLLLGLLGAAVGLSAAAGAEPVREVIRGLARVDGQVLTDLDLRRWAGRPVPREGSDRLDPRTQSALVEMAIHRLEVQEATARGIPVAETLVDAAFRGRIDRMGGPDRFRALLASAPFTAEDVRTQVRESLLVYQLYLKVLAGPPGGRRANGRVLPSEVRERYRTHREQYRTPIRVHLQLIEIRPRDGDGEEAASRARSVLARIRGGEDFAAVARTESRGPMADRGGDLGWAEPGRLDPSLDAFVLVTPPGTVSDLLPTPAGGWWIARVLEREERRPRPFEDVQEEIADGLRSERLTALRRATLRRLVRDAAIDPPWLRTRVTEAVESVGEPEKP